MNDELCIDLLLEFQNDIKERILFLSSTPLRGGETPTERLHKIGCLKDKIQMIDEALGVTYDPKN